MTNREKFKSVFGVDYSCIDFNKIADNAYGKLKKYKVRMYECHTNRKHGPYPWDKDDRIVYVYASNSKNARTNAISILGEAYKVYEHSNRPIYALEVTECKKEVDDGQAESN